MGLETRGSKKIDPSLPKAERDLIKRHREAVKTNRRDGFSIFRRRRRGSIKR